eukprot:2576218-Prymnesium_polylepis.1
MGKRRAYRVLHEVDAVSELVATHREDTCQALERRAATDRHRRAQRESQRRWRRGRPGRHSFEVVSKLWCREVEEEAGTGLEAPACWAVAACAAYRRSHRSGPR